MLFSLVLLLLIFPIQVRINSFKEQPGEALIRIGFIRWKWGVGKKVNFPLLKSMTALNKEQLLLFLRNFKSNIFKNRKQTDFLYKRLLRKGKLRRLYWRLYLGHADYAITGILTGVCWAIIELFIIRLNRYTHIETNDVKIDIIPKFGDSCLMLEFDCIFEIRIIHIIIEFLNYSLRFKYV